MHPALREKAQVPYNICLVELDEQEGLRILTNLLNVPPEAIRIGMPVGVCFQEVPNSPNLVLPFFIPEASSP